MQRRNLKLRGSLVKAVLIAGSVIFIFFCILTAKWSFGNVTATRAEEPQVAELGVQLARRDPQAHFEFATLLEKTFLAADQAKALEQFELAAALSPNNYEYWLALARSCEHAGDQARAEQALKKAAELAPNYSRVRWALGNALLRQGRTEEAFSEIRKAVGNDQTFSIPAAAMAFQIFGGDVQKIADAIGDSPRIKVSLAVQLVTAKRLDEAKAIWSQISAEDKRAVPSDIAKALYSQLVEAGKYATAITIGTETGLFTTADAAVNAIANSDFESALASNNENALAWSIADGTQPRIGLNESQKHSGNYSLLISYGTRGKGPRPIRQKVGVEAAAAYVVRFYYRSELNKEAEFRCEIVRPGSDEPITSIVLPPTSGWSEAVLEFVAPADEGIDLRLADRCSGPNCIVSGNIWFDDFSLSRR